MKVYPNHLENTLMTFLARTVLSNCNIRFSANDKFTTYTGVLQTFRTHTRDKLLLCFTGKTYL